MKNYSKMTIIIHFLSIFKPKRQKMVNFVS